MRERERERNPPLGVGTPRDPTSLSALAQNLENDGNSRRPNTSFIWNNRDVMIYKSYILCTITFKCFYTSFYEIRNIFGCFVITFSLRGKFYNQQLLSCHLPNTQIPHLADFFACLMQEFALFIALSAHQEDAQCCL